MSDPLAPPDRPERTAQLVELAARLQRSVHETAVASSPMFSVEHWKHHAGEDWPHEPDDDSYLFFENCVHPDCKLVRDVAVPARAHQEEKEHDDQSRVAPLKAGGDGQELPQSGNEASPSLPREDGTNDESASRSLV